MTKLQKLEVIFYSAETLIPEYTNRFYRLEYDEETDTVILKNLAQETVTTFQSAEFYRHIVQNVEQTLTYTNSVLKNLKGEFEIK